MENMQSACEALMWLQILNQFSSKHHNIFFIHMFIRVKHNVYRSFVFGFYMKRLYIIQVYVQLHNIYIKEIYFVSMLFIYFLHMQSFFKWLIIAKSDFLLQFLQTTFEIFCFLKQRLKRFVCWNRVVLRNEIEGTFPAT